MEKTKELGEKKLFVIYVDVLGLELSEIKEHVERFKENYDFEYKDVETHYIPTVGGGTRIERVN